MRSLTELEKKDPDRIKVRKSRTLSLALDKQTSKNKLSIVNSSSSIKDSE